MIINNSSANYLDSKLIHIKLLSLSNKMELKHYLINKGNKIMGKDLDFSFLKLTKYLQNVLSEYINCK